LRARFTQRKHASGRMKGAGMLTKLLIYVVCTIFLPANVVQGGVSPDANIVLLPDGNWQTEGHRYVTTSALVDEINRLQKRKPQSRIHIVIDGHLHYGVVAVALATMQKSGIDRICRRKISPGYREMEWVCAPHS
jgi:biopolymer transport protein ExbD